MKVACGGSRYTSKGHPKSVYFGGVWVIRNPSSLRRDTKIACQAVFHSANLATLNFTAPDGSLEKSECRLRFIFEAEGGNEDSVLVNLTSIPLDGVDTGRK